MLSVEEYLGQLLRDVAALPSVEMPLDDAVGLVLAESIRTTRPSPSFDNSSMDGYAVRSSDFADVGDEVTLTVVDDIAAGSMPIVEVDAGQAARIMTGAPIPPGADCVVPIEHTDAGTSTVTVRVRPEPGACIRRAGDDFAANVQVLDAGEVVTARTVALLAACDRASVLVRPRPRVCVISTGDELVPAGSEVAEGRVVDSNGPLLLAAARSAGAEVRRIGPVPDDAEELVAALEDACRDSDLILTSGGVSMGAYDVVKHVLTQRGGVEFTKVAMQPGMPQGHGRVDGVPIITLPGNPVSSYVSFEVFVRPVLHRMQGRPDTARGRRAVLGADLTSPGGKRQFARGTLRDRDGELVVDPVGGQGSHVLGGLAHADCLLLVPEEITSLQAGDEVVVWDLRE